MLKAYNVKISHNCTLEMQINFVSGLTCNKSVILFETHTLLYYYFLMAGVRIKQNGGV